MIELALDTISPKVSLLMATKASFIDAHHKSYSQFYLMPTTNLAQLYLKTAKTLAIFPTALILFLMTSFLWAMLEASLEPGRTVWSASTDSSSSSPFRVRMFTSISVTTGRGREGREGGREGGERKEGREELRTGNRKDSVSFKA